MPLLLSPATIYDAPRIAEIHMLAFSQNAMLLAQFPTPAVRQELQKAIEAKTRVDIRDSRISVLVVKDVATEEQTSNSVATDAPPDQNTAHIIAFAKWDHPIQKGENGTETPWVWPQGTNLQMLNAWAKKMEDAEREMLGGSPCYRLSFMGTDPLHQKRGAASLMIQWGLDKCRRDGVPAYLESTMEAVPLYKSHGFNAAAEISLRIDDENVYEEMACIYWPEVKA